MVMKVLFVYISCTSALRFQEAETVPSQDYPNFVDDSQMEGEVVMDREACVHLKNFAAWCSLQPCECQHPPGCATWCGQGAKRRGLGRHRHHHKKHKKGKHGEDGKDGKNGAKGEKGDALKFPAFVDHLTVNTCEVKQELTIIGKTIMGEGCLSVDDGVQVNCTLLVQDSSTFEEDVIMSKELTASFVTVKDTISVGSDVKIDAEQGEILGKSLVITEGVRVGDLEVTDSLSVGGPSILSDMLQVSGSVALNNTLQVQGSVVLSNDLEVGGDVGLKNNARITKNLVVSGRVDINQRLDVGTDVDITDSLTVGGLTVLDSSLTVGGAMVVEGDSQLNQTLLVKKKATFESDVLVSGNAEFKGNVKLHGKVHGVDDVLYDGKMSVSGDTQFANKVKAKTLDVTGTTTLNSLVVSGHTDLYTLSVHAEDTLTIRGVGGVTKITTLESATSTFTGLTKISSSANSVNTAGVQQSGFQVSSASDFQAVNVDGTLTSSDIYPKNDESFNLGSATLAFKDVYAAGIIVNAATISGKTQIAADADTIVEGVLEDAGLQVSCSSDFAKAVKIDATLTSQDVLPKPGANGVSGKYSLGSSSAKWWNVAANNVTTGNAIIDTITVTNKVPVASGGTGLGAFAKGDMIYASATNTIAGLTRGSTGQMLIMGTGNLPTWGGFGNNDILMGLTGGKVQAKSFLTTAQGGTGKTSWAKGDITIATSTNVLGALSKGTDAQMLVMGTGDLPVWQAYNPVPATVGSGSILVGGTSNAVLAVTSLGVSQGGTGKTGWTKGDIAIASSSSATGALTALSKGTEGQMLAMGSGNLPVWQAYNAVPATVASGKILVGGSNNAVVAAAYNAVPATVGSGQILVGGTDNAVAVATSLGVSQGGTGKTSWSKGDIAIASSSSSTGALTGLAKGSDGQMLAMGSANLPAWQAYNAVPTTIKADHILLGGSGNAVVAGVMYSLSPGKCLGGNYVSGGSGQSWSDGGNKNYADCKALCDTEIAANRPCGGFDLVWQLKTSTTLTDCVGSVCPCRLIKNTHATGSAKFWQTSAVDGALCYSVHHGR